MVPAAKAEADARQQEPAMTRITETRPEALAADDLDRVAGGIIIIGGRNLAAIHASSLLDRVALNPQPLPPMPAGNLFSFGR
jgi:hypothetical protein